MPNKELEIRANKILKILDREFPDAGCTLTHKNPLDILVATILSAQCTDARVNIVTKDLFKKYKKAADYAEADLAVLEEEIHSTGFYKNKAKNIKACCRELTENHNGKVPDTLEELVKLPGVGRKTANVVLGNAFGIPGITVDTHVGRVSQRLGLTKNSDAAKIEFDLMELIPKKKWTKVSHQIILHGRRTCSSRKPKCDGCPLLRSCDYGQRQ